MTIFISVIIGLSVGFILGFIVRPIIKRIRKYSGVMKIIREENKTIYSLELHEDPIMLEHKSEVVFKVETSGQSSDRKQN